MFVALGHDLEKQVGLISLKRQVAHLVNDENAGAQQRASHEVIEPSQLLRLLQLEHEIRGRDEPHLHPGLRCQIPQGNGEAFCQRR